MKAKILRKGLVIGNEPMFWAFNCLETVPAVEVRADGTVLYGGYTVDELREIADKPEADSAVS